MEGGSSGENIRPSTRSEDISALVVVSSRSTRGTRGEEVSQDSEMDVCRVVMPVFAGPDDQACENKSIKRSES